MGRKKRRGREERGEEKGEAIREEGEERRDNETGGKRRSKGGDS